MVNFCFLVDRLLQFCFCWGINGLTLRWVCWSVHSWVDCGNVLTHKLYLIPVWGNVTDINDNTEISWVLDVSITEINPGEEKHCLRKVKNASSAWDSLAHMYNWWQFTTHRYRHYMQKTTLALAFKRGVAVLARLLDDNTHRGTSTQTRSVWLPFASRELF